LGVVGVASNALESLKGGEFKGENIDVFGGLADKLGFAIFALLD
jgi:hypothetical protein